MRTHTVKMLERKFEERFLNRLRSLPKTWWPEKTDSLSRGLPDRIGSVGGFFVALEFKINKSEANKNTGRIVLQKHRLEKIRKSGGLGFIVFPGNADEIYKKLKELTA